MLYLHLDRGEEALELVKAAEVKAADWQDKEKLAIQRNQSAYFRAVANLELEAAEAGIDTAMHSLAPLEIGTNHRSR